MTSSDSSLSSAQPLQLRGLEPFGVGGRRLCFVHPLDPGKCVKVARQDAQRTIRTRQNLIPRKWRREYDNNAHEQKILTHLFRRVGPAAAECLPRCYGVTETDLGPGLVLDLMRDRDGGISRSIRELITTGLDVSQLRPAFDEFGRLLLQHRIVTRQLLDHNIVARHQADGGWQLFLIDGLGDPAWVPVTQWIPVLAKARIQKNLATAWARFEQFAASGGVTETMRRNSTWGQGLLNHRGL